MRIEQDFEGETYEIDVRLEDKRNLRHIAHYPIKSGPRTFKSVNVFEVKASTTGKKIVCFWKSKLDDSMLTVEEETQFECQPEELEKLIALIDNLEDICNLDRGDHVILKQNEPSTEAALAAVDSIQSANSDGAEELALKLIKSVGEIAPEADLEEVDGELPEEVATVEHLISHARTRNALREFREMVEDEVTESEYQAFLEGNSWIFGHRYVSAREDRQITRDEEVDFCLETVSGYFDIFEIKRPQHTVMVEDTDHDTYKASSKLSEAVAQVENYIKEIEANHGEILRRDGVDMLKPRGNIVIGANLDPEEREGLRIHNTFLNNIRVMTYTELAQMGERLVEVYEK